MKVSVVVTILNEQETIAKLLTSLLNQSKKPSEIVIVDGGSTDKTVQIIRHFQKKDRRVKFLIEKCSRAKGRNLGVEITKNSLIAMTDAGCVAHKHWLKRLVTPFKHKEVDMVAGFYKMVGKNPFQKASSVFLGVLPQNFDIGFLPSTRSVAFRKQLWERIGGFPEKLPDTAEDTVFNYKAVKSGAKIAREKNARVEWRMPDSISEFSQKIFGYAKGDAKSRVWWHPTKGFSSHNLKVILVFARYLAGLGLLVYAIKNSAFLTYVIIGLFIYCLWAFRKVYVASGDWHAAIWGIVMQYASDFSVMAGFIAGLVK